MAKTFMITTKSTYLEPYWQALSDGSHPEIEYTDKQTYRKLPREAAILVLKEFFDAPDEDMTIEDTKREFSGTDRVMSDQTASKIVAYYNGRKALYEKLLSLIDDNFEYEKMDIPESLNGFTTVDDDKEFEKTHQIEAWVEVKAEDQA